MCLRVDATRPAPTKNFSVWKVLTINNRGQLQTPVRNVPVSAGELLPASQLVGEIHSQRVIEGGVIHVHTSAIRAKRSQDLDQIIVRCVVKPSEFVAWGRNIDAGVAKLRISHTAIANALKKHGEWLRKDLDVQRKLLVVQRKLLVAVYNRRTRRLQKAKRKLK